MRKPPSHWVGDGFHVYPVFENKAFTAAISPFLMFDYGAPRVFPPTKKQLGVGQHPHRGFETVTIAFQGEVEHSDSLGNRGVIGPGDVQWMTAARGIVHEEFHSKKMAAEGGTLEMCQLWVNLPAAAKMAQPKYQPILAKDIPVLPLFCPDDVAGAGAGAGAGAEATVSSDGDAADIQSETGQEGAGGPSAASTVSTVRVITGSYRGQAGAAATHTPMDVWDVDLGTTEKTYQLETPEGHNTLIFVRRGAVEIMGQTLSLADLAILSLDGTLTNIRAREKHTKILVLSGLPIDEPIAARGPFVMNTQLELQQAMSDYQQGRNGF